MDTSGEQPTLRQDWQRRRAILEQSVASPREYTEIQIRVLDYLLTRYGEEPEAAQPAKFPVPTEVYFNERAVLVHHHVGKDLDSGVKTAAAAGILLALVAVSIGIAAIVYVVRQRRG